MGRVYVLVQAGRRPGAAKKIMRWVRALLPSAVLLATPGALPTAEDDDAVVVSIDADDVVSGPLALADAIARGRSITGGSGGSSIH
ncbi:MAG TPA: hypothetical protein VFK85_16055 [Anaeromyxobacteraceae bacterium]|nr:hypothetical protein [Anaeromyxobacteraceae bacterium]